MQHNQITGILAWISEPKEVNNNKFLSIGIIDQVNREKDEAIPLTVWNGECQKVSEMQKGDLVAAEFSVRRKNEETLDVSLSVNYIRRLRKKTQS